MEPEIIIKRMVGECSSSVTDSTVNTSLDNVIIRTRCIESFNPSFVLYMSRRACQ